MCNASVWRWCGHLACQFLTFPFRDGVADAISELWSGLKTALTVIASVIALILVGLTAPVSFPMLAIYRRRSARRQHGWRKETDRR